MRTALTAETWTAINDAWLELKRFEASRRVSPSLDREALMRFLDYVKKASLDFDGSCYRTMLRNDAYWFNRLGIFIERADNTARLLDVKYHLLLPSTEAVGDGGERVRVASMRPRRTRLGCPIAVEADVSPAPSFNEAEAHAPRMPCDVPQREFADRPLQ